MNDETDFIYPGIPVLLGYRPRRNAIKIANVYEEILRENHA
jgi:hypothetical protein